MSRTSATKSTELHPTTTATMRAVTQAGYGTAEVLHAAEVPVPGRLGADEVLVRVHAAGLDRGTWHLMTGTPYAVRLVTGLRRPRQPILGLDLSGTVEAVGAGVTGFAAGGEGLGIGTRPIARDALGKAGKVARKPAGGPHEQAAAGA